VTRIAYDDQFIRECDAMDEEKCDAYAAGRPTCDGCPAWEGLKTRDAARAPSPSRDEGAATTKEE
jgi:hypothetical protein